MTDAAPDKATPVAPIEDLKLEPSEIFKVLGSGFAMGSADVVPGVSGGTMAVACGIYERLLAAIASINPASIKALLRLDFKEVLRLVHFKFLACLLLGIGSAVVVMVKIVGLPQLLLTQPTLVYSVFFGLVLASVFILGKTIKWGGLQVLSLILGTLFGWLVVTLVPVDMPGSSPFMFLYGMIAISAMLLPGISGSFILLILGQYERIIGAIESLIHLDFSALLIVVPFGLGCILGITLFSRVVAFLLRNYHDVVVAGLCGLLVGSLWRIWPFQNTVTEEVRGKVKVIEATPFIPDHISALPIILVVAGFCAVFAVEALASRRVRSAQG